MSLKEIAMETLGNFDPAKDNPNGQGNIPVGEYDVIVEKAGHVVYESGYDCVAITCKVVGGEYDNRNELININVDPETESYKKYPFLLSKNIKMISQLAFACDINLSDDDWEDQLSLGDAFAKEAVGKQFVLEITESKNKKDPSNPYRNYQFLKYAEDELPF
ncbi:DUF669 domain-containing protein [Facklamia sp. P12945]|uniref:DUF669 domain-containing protein n=1 Tax=unclassified Facklamia TaxID=2622293 RepID=UPI003D17A35A